MALLSFSSSFMYRTNPELAINSSASRRPAPHSVRCTASDKATDQPIARRSANYHHTIWHHDFLQSLEKNSQSKVEKVTELKEQVKNMLEMAEASRLDQLELIDSLQRLGVSHHFEKEIDGILKSIFLDKNYASTMDGNLWEREDLHAISLEFRLLREHGLDVPQEVVESFRDETGNFKASLRGNIKAMLSLYEASYLSREGEMIMDDARDFTRKYLKCFVDHNYSEDDDSEKEYLRAMASHALELPYHWRMRRPEARWFIDVYRAKPKMNPVLLEFAILDFNMAQATHQEDLRHLSMWWRNIDFSNQLTFVRDRIAEEFLWSVGLIYEPQYGYFRRMLTKIIALVLTIDDIYDIYGTMEELQLFTESVERWDLNKLEDLPEYMRLCFLVLFNVTNEIAFGILRDQKINVIPHLKEVWLGMCKSFMVEARWYRSRYKPSLSEYMDNAWVSSAAPVVLVNAYCILTPTISKEALDLLSKSSLIRSSGVILRLANDLGTSSEEIKRGDVPKAMQSFMHETGASEVEAQQHVWRMIRGTWEEINKDRAASSLLFSCRFWEVAVNLARSALTIYQFGDGLGSSNHETRDRVSAVFIQPVQLN